MEKARSLTDFLDVFRPSPLSGEDLKKFYCKDTMAVRTGDAYVSPIQDIYDACQRPSEGNTFLLLGHRGCGKSTELNVMADKLKKAGYLVSTVPCGKDMDTYNPDYSDLLILMGDALLNMADQCGCELDSDLAKRIKEFWGELEITRETVQGGSSSLEGEVKVGTPSFLKSLLTLSAQIKNTLRFNEERRTVFRERISRRLSDWTDDMNLLADAIAETLGKQPILIFEDLDKMDSAAAKEVFQYHSKSLSAPSFPLIYTFPIASSYDTWFHPLEADFQVKTFPMIKLEYPTGGRCEEGYRTMEEIVGKRADLSLFEEKVLDLAIEKTGGSLRDLFTIIKQAATRAVRRDSRTINREDVERALMVLRSTLTRFIERKQYAFLAEIARGNREKIENKKMLLEMLQAGVVLEYNGTRWYNVHPLVTDFLTDQGLM